MIATLASQINELIDLSWMEKKHALVFSNSLKIEGKAKTFPFPWGTVECNDASIATPDTRYRAVTWYEGGQPQPVRHVEGGDIMRANMRVVCWIQCNKIGTDQLIGDKCLLNLKKELAALTLESDELKVIKISVSGVVNDARNILGKYNFEDKAMLLLYPYYLGAIDFSATYIEKCSSVTVDSECS
ncbi:MAG: hypothetical protein JNM00_09500 [Flavobacteriales bacterium]|nr:hypothetical protein [Flavobacteriales bacterium]